MGQSATTGDLQDCASEFLLALTGPEASRLPGTLADDRRCAPAEVTCRRGIHGRRSARGKNWGSQCPKHLQGEGGGRAAERAGREWARRGQRRFPTSRSAFCWEEQRLRGARGRVGPTEEPRDHPSGDCKEACRREHYCGEAPS